jgi:nicotinamide mononucleotide (NMN) deamidase PncC
MIVIILFGIDPKTVKQLLIKNVPSSSDLAIRYYEAFMETKLEIDENNSHEFRSIMSDIVSTLSKFTYATEDVTLYERTAELIKLRNKTLTIMEQVSAGRITSNLLSYENMENNIEESFVMLSKESWIKNFDIHPKDVSDNVRISSKNAYEISTNLISKSLSDIIIVTLGVLEESEELMTKSLQPKGMCYVAIGDKDMIDVKKYNFSGNRSEIIEAVSKTVCWNLINKLK